MDNEHIYLDLYEVKSLEYFYFVCDKKCGSLQYSAYISRIDENELLVRIFQSDLICK